MRKKVLIAGLAVMMSLGITACNNNTSSSETTESTNTTVSPESTTVAQEGTTVESTTAESTTAVQEETTTVVESTTETVQEQEATTEQKVEKPVKQPEKKPSKKPSKKPEKKPNKKPDKKPEKKPNKKPESTTEKKEPETTTEEKKEVSLQQVVEEVKKAYGDSYMPNMAIDRDILAEQYGLTEDLYDEVIAEGPALSFQIDTFIAVKAKEGKAEDTKKALEKYKKYLEEESLQYPMNAAKIPATEIYSFGDYVFFSMLVTPKDSKAESEEQILAEAKKMNKIAYSTVKNLLK